MFPGLKSDMPGKMKSTPVRVIRAGCEKNAANPPPPKIARLR
jgi:hypothetical protein